MQTYFRRHHYRAQDGGSFLPLRDAPGKQPMTEDEEARAAPIDSADLDDGSEAEERFSPNGTPLPVGPPPPHTVQTERALSHRLSGALANALAGAGVQASPVLTMVRGDIRDLARQGGLRVDISHLGRRLARQHPNTLWLADEESPDEDQAPVETTVEADDPDDPRSSTGPSTTTSNSAAVLTHTIVAAMEREGRTLMNAEEEASLVNHAELRAVINSLDGEERSAFMRNPTMAAAATSSDTSSTHAVAVNPSTPPTYTDRTRGGATAKPKPNRKCESQLLQPPLFLAVAAQHCMWHAFFWARDFVRPGDPGDDTVKVTSRDSQENRHQDRLLYTTSGPLSWLRSSPVEQQLRPENKKTATIPEYEHGDTKAIGLRTMWLARYAMSTTLTTTAQSLHIFSRTSWIRVCMNYNLGHRYLTQFCSSIATTPAGSFSSSLQQPTPQRDQQSQGPTEADITTSKYSRTGPKSGDIHRRHANTSRFSLMLLLTRITTALSVNVDARVASGSMPLSGAPQGAKPNGTREASMPTVATINFNTARIQKRTYRRAYARSVRQGGAYYRGQWRDYSWFQPADIRPVYLHKRRLGHRPVDRKHYRVLTWNAGGLSQSVFQELETFVRDAHYDIIFIQETKWSADYNWSNKDYHYVHSAGVHKADKVGGLLTMVSTQLAKPDDLQFLSVHAGRIQHVRFGRGNLQTDLVNVYQHVANEKKATTEHRHSLLQRLQRCLASIPRRNGLIIAGDMNTSCTPMPQVCGTFVLPVGEYHKADHMDFMHLCESMSLCVLNSWTKPDDNNTATFTFGRLSSQIDFVITRQTSATTEAKTARALRDFPVACWRDGAKHHPVEANIPITTHRWHSAPKKPANQVDTDKLIADLKLQQAPDSLKDFRNVVAEQVTQDLDEMEKVVLQAALRYYPRKKQMQQEPTQPQELANSARHMWQLFRQMRSQRFTAQGILQAWQLWVRFSQAHRLHKQRSQTRSKVRRAELLQEAQTAAARGNSHAMWQVVKKLAPKSKSKKVQLYKNGHIMHPDAELDWIASAFGERYGTSFAQAPPNLVRQHPPVLLEVKQVREILLQTPLRKAVPPNALPSVVWRACLDQIIHPLVDKVNQDWQKPEIRIRQDWAKADVALLPKGKPNASSPLDWRPIGLQHPLGKAIMKALMQGAKEQIASIVARWPQTAYLPGRSTTTALKTVFAHCDHVRSGCARTRLTIHEKHDGQSHSDFYGGLQVSLDLTAAFDLVGWGQVQEALSMAEVQPFTCEIVMQWLRQVVYVFHHRGSSRDVRPNWGLRQGCPASPLLWSVFTALLCQAIDHRMQAEWTASHAVLFADDSHLRWCFNSFAGFEQAITELRWVLKIFERYGMIVNAKKTQAILMLTGKDKGRIQKHYIRSSGDGKRLLLSPKNPDQWVPLVTKAEYLGLVIAYERFEALSTRHRIQKANQRRWILASVLHSRKLSIKYKLQIWRSCVQSSLLYGLHSFGLSLKLLQELQITAMKHIRAVIADPRHITGHTDVEVREKHNIDTMLTLLEKAHCRELNNTRDDWMTLPDWDLRISRSFEEAQQEGHHDAADSTDAEQWACPECDSFFSTAAALKIHAQRAHGWMHKPLDRGKHAIQGLPTCRFCEKRFSRWQTLEQHINSLACPKMLVLQTDGTDNDPKVAIRSLAPAAGKETTDSSSESELGTSLHSVRPPASQLSVRQAATRGLRHFIPMHSTTRFLHQHCGLCGQWVASNRVMKLHYRNTHPEVFPALQKSIHRIIQSSATACVSCHFCGESQRDWRAHPLKCTTIWQCAVLCVLQQPEHVHWYEQRPGDGRILRSVEGPSFANDVHRASQRQETQRKPTILTALGARQRPPRQLQPESLAGGIPPRSPSRPDGLHARQASHPSGGGDQAVAAGYIHGPMANLRTGLGVAPSFHHGNGVQEEATCRTDVGPVPHAPQTGLSPGSFQRAEGPPCEGYQHSGAPSTSTGDGVERLCRLEVSDVEPEAESVGARHVAKPSDRTGDDKETRKLRGEHQGGCGPQISLHPTHDRNHGGKENLQVGLVSPQQECGNGLGPAGGTSGLLCVPAHRLGLQTGEAEQRASSPEDPGDDSLLRQRFANKGNACYMNATVQSMQWMLHISGQETSQMGEGGRFFQALRAAGRDIDLMQVQQWGMLIAGWVEAHRQHDIGEFMGYLLTRIRPPIMQGRWQARCLADDGRAARCLDQGLGTQALPLGIPSRPLVLRRGWRFKPCSICGIMIGIARSVLWNHPRYCRYSCSDFKFARETFGKYAQR